MSVDTHRHKKRLTHLLQSGGRFPTSGSKPTHTLVSCAGPGSRGSGSRDRRTRCNTRRGTGLPVSRRQEEHEKERESDDASAAGVLACVMQRPLETGTHTFPGMTSPDSWSARPTYSVSPFTCVLPVDQEVRMLAVKQEHQLTSKPP